MHHEFLADNRYQSITIEQVYRFLELVRIKQNDAFAKSGTQPENIVLSSNYINMLTAIELQYSNELGFILSPKTEYFTSRYKRFNNATLYGMKISVINDDTQELFIVG